MRHAFDADHIAAIDNTTRKLLTDRKKDDRRPLSVGFWFSLGHSTVVFLLVLLLTVGISAIAGQLSSDDSTLKRVGSLIGTTVSGVVPDPHRDRQPGGAGRDHQGVPADALGAFRRGRACGPAS